MIATVWQKSFQYSNTICWIYCIDRLHSIKARRQGYWIKKRTWKATWPIYRCMWFNNFSLCGVLHRCICSFHNAVCNCKSNSEYI